MQKSCCQGKVESEHTARSRILMCEKQNHDGMDRKKDRHFAGLLLCLTISIIGVLVNTHTNVGNDCNND